VICRRCQEAPAGPWPHKGRNGRPPLYCEACRRLERAEGQALVKYKAGQRPASPLEIPPAVGQRGGFRPRLASRALH
jgi:hypothetical protein